MPHQTPNFTNVSTDTLVKTKAHGASTNHSMSDQPVPPIAQRLRLARKALGLTQKELAIRVGMGGQTSIGEIERGSSARPLKLRELSRELGRSEAWLLGELPLEAEEPPASIPGQAGQSRSSVRPQPNAGAPVQAELPQAAPVPIYGQAEGGADGRFVLNGEELARTFRPPSLVGVRHAYAVYVYGHSMEDRFQPGDLVWVDPNRPVKQGDDVVVQIRPEVTGEIPFGYVKRFISRNGEELVLKQLNPPEGADPIIRFPSETVISVHKVVFVEPG